ncbi:MAG: hypothetical protein ACXW32_12085 [Limisphaerales bacterium]
MKNKVFSTMLLGAAVPMVTGEAAEFIPLGEATGTVFSSVIDLSADGTTVLGIGYTGTSHQIFRWSAELGYSILPSYDPGTFFPNFFATSISGDGSVVAGYATDGSSYAGLKWNAVDGFIDLGFLPTQDQTFGMAFPVGIADDGGAVALYGTAPNTPYYTALMWTDSLGLVSLGFLPGDEPDAANFSQSFSWGLSGDGQVVVGSSFSTRNAHGDQAFRWTAGEGMEPLGFLEGENTSGALTVSADGSVVVGMSGMYAFRWTAETGMENIGSFSPSAVSADGDIIVGTSLGQDEAVIWTSGTAVQPLKDYLLNTFNLSVPFQSLIDAVAISNDGRVIAGTGYNADGNEEAFLVSLGDEGGVETSGAVSFAGAVSLYLVDPTGGRYGIDPVTGASFSEIADLTLSEEGSLKKAAWPGFAGGEHLIHLTGTGAGSYQLGFDFLHLDKEASGAAFSRDLLPGGLHIYAATVAADTADGASYRLVYADTDGDKVEDASDAVPRSNLRPTIVINGIDTGVKNKVLADGTTLNDAIACVAVKAGNRGNFVSAMNKLTQGWTSAGIITKSEAAVIHNAVTGDTSTMLTKLSRATLEEFTETAVPQRSVSAKPRGVRAQR